jgi:hypothetical protein
VSYIIERSPTYYILYYKRGISHSSLSGHAPGWDDFAKVFSLTSNAFYGMRLMIATIYVRDERWSHVRKGLDLHRQKKTDECYQSATRVLRVGAYVVGVREMSAECALRTRDL